MDGIRLFYYLSCPPVESIGILIVILASREFATRGDLKK